MLISFIFQAENGYGDRLKSLGFEKFLRKRNINSQEGTNDPPRPVKKGIKGTVPITVGKTPRNLALNLTLD